MGWETHSYLLHVQSWDRVFPALLVRSSQRSKGQILRTIFVKNGGETNVRVLSERPLFGIEVPSSSSRGIPRHRLILHTLSI